MSTGELAGSFARLQESDRRRASEMVGIKYRSLFGLGLAHKVGMERVTASDLAEAMDTIGISLSSEQIRKAFDASRGLVSARRGTGAATYRLMQDGRAALDEVGAGIAVVRFEGGKPLTARQTLGDLFGGLEGIVRVSDPYYGQKTVGILAEIRKASEVRFLTSKCGGGENEGSVRGLMRDLIKEHPTVSIRFASTVGTVSHDRFALTDQEMVLIGHGLKDLGSRDSFLIRLPLEYVAGIAAETSKEFDRLWSIATAL